MRSWGLVPGCHESALSALNTNPSTVSIGIDTNAMLLLCASLPSSAGLHAWNCLTRRQSGLCHAAVIAFRVSCMTAIRITPAAATVAFVRTRTRIIRLWQRLLGDQLTNPREHICGLAFSIRQSRHCSRRTAVLSRLAPPTVRQRRATLRQSLELSRQSPDWVRWMLQLLRQIRACFRQVAGAFRLLTQPVRTIRDRD